MTILLRGKTHFISRLKSLTLLQRLNHTLTEEGSEAQVFPEMGYDFRAKQSYVVDKSKWRKLNARYHGIFPSMIPSAPWIVLKILRAGGFEAYLVGGCVRDLLLNRVPKDFDVITTANLKEIKKKFCRAQIVGRRFPICKVHVKGSAIEVSSFETAAQQSQEKEKVLLSQMLRSCDEKDFLRWRNSMHRDFTINSLFFDPFMNRIYDYTNGMADLRLLKLQTLIPAQLSFQEDCARILRGIRIAGRLGLSISKDTETAICKLSSSIKSLNKDRIMMELNYMLSYGAAESTILLLQRFNLLKIFFPFHAAYLHEQAGEISAQGSTMLMKLLSSLDKMVSSDRPCDCILWVGLLAFHQALVLNPQDAFVIWVFASILYCGTWQQGVQFARENAKVQERFVPEISGFSEIKSDENLAEEVYQLASLVQDTVDAFTDEISLSESLSRYLDSPFYDLVFVSKKMGKHVALLFHTQSCEYRRESFKIDYDLLGKGNLHETRFVLGKVILETLSGDGLVVKKEKKHISLSFDEQKQETAKQQENIKMKHASEQGINNMKEDVILKGAPMEIAKKKQKVVDTSRVCEESDKKQVAIVNEQHQHRAKKHRKMVEKVKHHELCSQVCEESDKKQVAIVNEQHQHRAKKHRKMVEKVKHHELRSQVCEESDKKQVAIVNEQHQHRAKKHRKMVEKAKHHELRIKETEELFNVIRKSNPSEDEKIKGGVKNDRPPVMQKLVKVKTKKLKHVMAKEKSVRSSLSSLFK